jgi:hypothetical protein
LLQDLTKVFHVEFNLQNTKNPKYKTRLNLLNKFISNLIEKYYHRKIKEKLKIILRQLMHLNKISKIMKRNNSFYQEVKQIKLTII